jgi:SAM-dependent methyltransferase
MTTPTDWSLAEWKRLHESGYFPNSKQHAKWRIYDKPPDWLLPHLHAKQCALEIGCGYGQWMIPVSRRVRAVFGIDIHRIPIRMAKEKFVEHDTVNALVVCSDGETIPFGQDRFDLVYSISVLQHIPRDIVEQYMAETTRVLTPGGKLLFHFRNMDNVGDYPIPAQDITVDHTGDFSVGWTAEEVTDLADRHGVTVHEIHDLGLHLVLEASV